MGIKISVIIATLNCQDVVEQAICSYITQKYENKELIVIDGESSDETVNILRKYETYITALIIEKDEGIYDAFNKGIGLATGDYIVFLGADDSFYCSNTLSKVASIIEREVYPDLLSTAVSCIEDGFLFINKKYYPLRLEYGIKYKRPMVPHQGLYAKKSLLSEHLFRKDYPICADFEFYLYCCKSKKRIVYNNVVTAYYSHQGMSSVNENKRREEANKILDLYKEKRLSIDYKSVLFRKIRQWLSTKKAGIIILVRFRNFKIHRCKNKKCRWCSYNRSNRSVLGFAYEDKFKK